MENIFTETCEKPSFFASSINDSTVFNEKFTNNEIHRREVVGGSAGTRHWSDTL